MFILLFYSSHLHVLLSKSLVASLTAHTLVPVFRSSRGDSYKALQIYLRTWSTFMTIFTTASLIKKTVKTAKGEQHAEGVQEYL